LKILKKKKLKKSYFRAINTIFILIFWEKEKEKEKEGI